MSKTSKLIVNCALTGSDTFPSQTPYLPITPTQIAEEAYQAYKAGASIVHVHAREPKTGKPTASLETWRQILSAIKERCDVVICPTTGGAMGMSAQERIAVVPEFQPEMCSFNTESMNFGLFQVINRIEKWKYDWEKPAMELTKSLAFQNSFEDLEIFAKTIEENKVKAECEIYGTNGLYNTRFLFRQGLLKPPVHMQFVLGVLGGTEASPYELIHLQTEAERIFGMNNYTWSVVGVGYPRQFAIGSLSISLGGHVRVGLEDNIYIRRLKFAKGNAELVEQIRIIAEILGREVATPDETRRILNLKGADNVNF